MWISGSPGAGKSAVASTLVSSLTRRRRLASSCFFKRGDAVLSEPTALWHTVAFDLCRFNTDVKDCIVDFLSKTEFRDGDIRLHFECMIEEPLTKNHDKLCPLPPVVVVDALDECGTDESQSAQRRILLDTISHWSCLPKLCKLIITSRDERLPASFHDEQLCRRIILETGDSVGQETREDIWIFFKQSFHEIRPSLGMSSTWPGKSAMDRLTERAAGLFIWAKTAIAFMEEKRGKPAGKLDLILAGDLGTRNDNVDSLYRQILDFYFSDVDDSMFDLFKAVIGAIIVVKIPFHRDDLKHFLGIQDEEDERQIGVILHSLSSVISADGTIRLRHFSFAEFLTDAKRCHDHRFSIDKNKLHCDLAFACLRLMKAGLKFNICGLETSYLRNHHVPGLSERITTLIPTRLQYSCRFWAAHLCEVTTDRNRCGALLKEVKDFLYVRLLYWLEVMSLIKEVPASSVALLTAAKWIKVSGFIVWVIDGL